MSDSESAHPGDPRRPDHEKYLLSLGGATYQAALLTGVCYDILRVWTGKESEPLEQEPLGALRTMIKDAGEATAGQEGELASLEHYPQFMLALEAANHLRNDLIHALPTAHGLQRRGSKYIKVEGNVWTFFTPERVDQVTEAMALAHRLGGGVLYGDNGFRVNAWYEKQTQVSRPEANEGTTDAASGR